MPTSEDRIDAVIAEGEKLKAWIRSKQSGGCRMLSEGDACQCPLCNVDHLLAALASQRQEQDHSQCHDLACNGDRTKPRGAKGVTCSCTGRDTAYSDLQRLRADYDALRKAVYPKDDRTWTAEQVAILAAAHREDSETIDSFNDVTMVDGIRQLRAAKDAADAQCAELRKYAQHSTTCPCQPYEAAPSKAQRIAWPSGPPNCTCGLADLLAPPQKDRMCPMTFFECHQGCGKGECKDMGPSPAPPQKDEPQPSPTGKPA